MKRNILHSWLLLFISFILAGVILSVPALSQERDSFDLLFSSEEKANLEDLIKTTQTTSKESQDELKNILNKYNELKKNKENLPAPMKQFVEKMEQAGLTSKINGALKHFKDFDSGLSNVLKKKEKIDNIIYFYDRYRPDKNDPFRSLVVLENLFTDLENYGLPKEEKYEAFSKPHIFMIRAGLRYFKTAVKNAREGCQAIQKQIRERGGDNCISEFRGGTGNGNNNDPKISSFVNLKTGQVVCRTGIRSSEGGELWTNQDGSKIYFWDLKKWTKLKCGLGTADELHMNWKLAHGSVMSSENFILWCNNRLGEYTKARDRAKIQFTHLQTVQQFNCRDEILQILSKQADFAHLLETVNHNEKKFVAKYIFKIDNVRNLAESLVNIITGNNLFYGYVSDNDGNRIAGAAVEIKCDSKSITTQTDGNGNFKVLGQINSDILQGLDAIINVSAPGYNSSSVSTKVNDQCRNLGKLIVKRDDELTIFPEESQIKVGETVEFKVLYTKK